MTQDIGQDQQAVGQRRLWLLVALALIGLVAAILLRDRLSFESLAEHRGQLLALRDDHFVLTLLGFWAIYITIVTLSLPGASLATLTGGFLFGVFPGVLVNILGATVGATSLFLTVRWGLGGGLASRIDRREGRVQRILSGLRDNEWSMLFTLRLLPVVPFFIANLVPAVAGASLRRFVISTALGIVPGTAIYTAVGAGLSDVFAAGGRPDLGAIFAPELLIPLLALGALAAAPAIVRLSRDKES